MEITGKTSVGNMMLQKRIEANWCHTLMQKRQT